MSAKGKQRAVGRRRLMTIGAAALVGLPAKGEARFTGGFVFESQYRGHRVRDRVAFDTPKPLRKSPLVIVGGGMAGLCAGWYLQKQGFRDFVLLEMEPQPGGNSRFGTNAVSAYPWGAHYIPVPNRESLLVREILAEFGALDESGQWREQYLCHSPQERLFLHGRWQEGIDPEFAADGRQREEFARFAQMTQELRATGAFTIPSAPGATKRTPALQALDRLTMQEWLVQNGFKSPGLHWFVDYSTRDDYGTAAKETSALAGLHYFAAREHEEKGPLTWPEGNGWLLQKLVAKLRPQIWAGQSVRQITRQNTKWLVDGESSRWLADAVIFAAPSFLAPHLIAEWQQPIAWSYSPWLVTNITLQGFPDGDLPPAWDNVIYGSPTLGYVHATHQSLRQPGPQTVITHYWALSQNSPAEERKRMLRLGWLDCCQMVLADLQRAHPRIAAQVLHMDVFRNGHAMVRPVPGYATDPARAALQNGLPGLWFANADLAGFSIFEEAQHFGVVAARKALRHLSMGGRLSSNRKP